MDIRTAILTAVLLLSLILFGIALLGFGFAEETHRPVGDIQEVTRIAHTQFPNARILVLFIIGFIIGLLAIQIRRKR